jgi:hypothetical protein
VAGTPSSRPTDAIACAVFLATLALLFRFHPFTRPVGLDPATWDYMSLALLDGRIPYRDVFLHKTPLAAFLGAAGAGLATLAGRQPVMGAHAVFLVLGALGPALIFALVSRRTTVAAGLVAAIWMIGSDQWMVGTLEGVRPKIATTVFGLACLLAGDRSRWRTAGLFGGLAVLCWQPAIAFLAGAAWAAWRQADRPARALSRLAVWSALVPTLMLVGFFAVGALGDFFAQAVGFNFGYIRMHARTPAETVAHLYELAVDWNAIELLLLPVALIGTAMRENRRVGAMTVAGGAYLALVFVDVQAWPDLILLAPFLAAVLGVGLIGVTRAAGLRGPATALVIALSLAAATNWDSGRLDPPLTWSEQAELMAQVESGLASDDHVLVVSYPEFLIHTGRHSVWPWPYLWFGVDRFAARTTAGGFDALLAGLDRDPPKRMIVARRWAGPLRRAFEQWARSRYSREEIYHWPHTVRPIVIYRLRR